MHRTIASAVVAASALLLASPVAAPATTGGTDGPSAESTPRLPFQTEVAQVFPEVRGGTRQSPDGTGLRGPATSTGGSGQDCTEVVVVRGDGGRNAGYPPGPDAAPNPARPVVQERAFASPAEARAAFASMRAAVRECAGETYSDRVETLTWRLRGTPDFGQDRIGWSLRRSFPTDTLALHYLALRGDRLVHTVVTKRRSLPPTGRSQQLMRVALRTLTSN